MEPSDREIQWRDYELSAKLYQFYVEQALRVNVLYFGFAGAIVSYVLAHSGLHYVRLGLLLPMLISLFLMAFLGISARPASFLDQDMRRLAANLNLTPNDFSPLVFVLIGFALLQFACAAALGFLMYAV
jgi:hypothetical protein